MKLAGLDIGTTTISGLVLDPETGRVDEVRTEPNDASIPAKAPWEVLQSPDAILRTAKRIASAFLDRHRDISAVGITGQMHGILYVDPRGRAASPLFTWQDRRGEQLDEGGVSFASRVAAAAGRQASTGMGSVTHYYNVRTGQVPEDASSLCTIADFVAMGLSGAVAPVIDATNAASLGCFDLRSQRFRADVLETLGIDPGIFPRVDASYPALGEIRRGVPVFVALGDNQAGFLGSVPDVSRSMLANVGTGSQLSVPLVDCADIEGIDVRPLPFGGCLGVGAALCGGRAYALLRDFFTRTLRMFGFQDAAADWGAMNAVDRSALPGEPLLVDTRLAGTRQDPAVRGCIGNLGLRNFTPEHLVDGVRRGIASELFGFTRCFPENLRAIPRRFIGSGNGIRESQALRRALEEAFGVRMQVPRHREEASFGAALLAGIASGRLSGVAEAGALIRFEAE